MLHDELKQAFMTAAEKPETIPSLIKVAQKRANPEVLAQYLQVGSLPNQLDAILGYSPGPAAECAKIAFLAAQNFSFEHCLSLAVWLTRIAFVVPEASCAVMDAISDGWLRGKAAQNVSLFSSSNRAPEQLRHELALPEPAPQTAPTFEAERKISVELQRLFWEEVSPGMGNIIENVTRFATAFGPDLLQGYVAAMLSHNGTPEAFEEHYLRPPLDIESLHDCAPETLGYSYYHQIVDNGLEVEILKSNQLVSQSSVTDYSGQRILQTHDLWHVVTAYTTDGLDEIALQSFQLAQLGSPFSSNLLAMLTTRATLIDPPMLPFVLRAICEGWRHGRTTGPLLPVRWEQYWNKPVEELRQLYQIKPHTANLMAV